MATAVAITVSLAQDSAELQQKAHEAQRIVNTGSKKLSARRHGRGLSGRTRLLRRPCAIKLIRPDQAGDPRTLMRLSARSSEPRLDAPEHRQIFDYDNAEDGTFIMYGVPARE